MPSPRSGGNTNLKRSAARSSTAASQRRSSQFYDMQQRIVLGGEVMHFTICGACCAAVPSGEKAQTRHLEWHSLLQQAIDAALPR
jgi:hypothetical protein